MDVDLTPRLPVGRGEGLDECSNPELLEVDVPVATNKAHVTVVLPSQLVHSTLAVPGGLPPLEHTTIAGVLVLKVALNARGVVGHGNDETLPSALVVEYSDRRERQVARVTVGTVHHVT